MDIADAAAACAGHKKGKLCREGGVLQGVPRGDDAYTGGKVVLIPAMAPGATGATGATGGTGGSSATKGPATGPTGPSGPSGPCAGADANGAPLLPRSRPSPAPPNLSPRGPLWRGLPCGTVRNSTTAA